MNGLQEIIRRTLHDAFKKPRSIQCFSPTLYFLIPPSSHHFLVQIKAVDREGNGTPLQYCCLENPMDGRAW